MVYQIKIAWDGPFSVKKVIDTLDNGLPQGAPTSPLISNAVLFDFEEEGMGSNLYP